MTVSPKQEAPAASIPCCPPLQLAPLAEDDAKELASILKALADPVRLRLISLIAAEPSGEACACNLNEPTGRSQATVSHHLSQLTKAGILHREQRGKWAWFSLDRDRLRGVCASLCAADDAPAETVGRPVLASTD